MDNKLGDDTKKWIDEFDRKGHKMTERLLKNLSITKSELEECCKNASENNIMIRKIRTYIFQNISNSSQKKVYNSKYEELLQHVKNFDVNKINNIKELTEYHDTITRSLKSVINISNSIISKKRKRNTDNSPDEYKCPITLELMRNPVICSDGRTYEKHAIIEILNKPEPKSPITRQTLNDKIMIPNHNLRKLIDDYIKENQLYNNI